MSKLSVLAIEAAHLAALRSRAAARLTGPAAAKGATAKVADALAVLHGLASRPATAADALTLLHELQVHQVELELQAQELQDTRAELEAALQRQVALYHRQPVGSFSIDARLMLFELNQTGAEMLGIDRDDAFGLPLDAYFSADSGAHIRQAVTGLGAAATSALASAAASAEPLAATAASRPAALALQLKVAPSEGPGPRQRGAEQRVLANIVAGPVAGHFVVILTPLGPAQDAPLTSWAG